ncbi:ASND1-like protein [Mya arenaria]|uniref:ASND1-like protein n=1 Tax=Mya arenaria TaxID=6604 RepID=A0ABY7FQL3_MYAAR|nr:ASND1-like protein [Mya arenaria]
MVGQSNPGALSISRKSLIIEQGRLSNRGPDSSNTVHTCVSNNVSALFSGHVLHLRGKQIVEQPTRDEAGNLLLWNGEIFGGIQDPVSDSDRWSVPDRLTGYTALSELNPSRAWNFIEVNVTEEELKEARQAHIQGLVYPLQTVLDDSIGCAVWFAARGKGVHGVGPHKGNPVHSTARVILCGMGADEQLVGYSRHRNKFKEGGWAGLIEEIELEVTRISARNLGRDDRIITDHGKESRFPFLDERVVTFLSSLPIHHKADLALPRGIGEKLLLRLCATELGLHQTATLAKRAIQFGSRIAKVNKQI